MVEIISRLGGKSRRDKTESFKSSMDDLQWEASFKWLFRLGQDKDNRKTHPTLESKEKYLNVKSEMIFCR